MTSPAHLAASPNHSWLTRLAKSQVTKTLSHLARGNLTIIETFAQGTKHTFGSMTDLNPTTTISVSHPNFWADTAFGGSVGAAECYAAGHWRCDDLTALVRLMVLNRDTLNRLEGGFALISSPMRRIFHWMHRNSRVGSRANIQAHYDLGNGLFEVMLDKTMAYSAAIFPTQDADLYTAQQFKFEQLAQQLALTPGMSIAEIGSGWGGLALYLAKHYDCHVTSITLSNEQLSYANAWAQREGLTDKVRFELCDYRDLKGVYDRVVSIEMIEAVGAEYLDTYAQQVGQLLKPDGRAVLQIIAIQDQLYQELLRSVDFIQKHIFPGSFIPSLTAVQNAFTAHTDCRIFSVKDIGWHYARTLKLWRENVMRGYSRLRELGYSDSFLRLWEYYLCYCEGGFLERQLSDLQIVLTKPGHRPHALSSR